MKNVSITIYLACRSRLTYLKEVVDSILGQDYEDFELIISDNSEGKEVGNFIGQHYPSVKYCWRNSVPALDHFNQILSEVSSEYFVIFHDDDVLLPNYLSEMVRSIQANDELGAVGCNAYIIWGNRKSKAIFAQEVSRKILISKPEELFQNYFDLDKRYHAPFPSYLYRTSLLNKLRFSSDEGGKYGDVSFLIKIVKNSSILWIPDKLMLYRFHPNNDRNIEDLQGRLSLLRFVLSKTRLKKNSRAVDAYRMVYLSRWFITHFFNQHGKQHSFLVVMHFLLIKYVRYFLPLCIQIGKKILRLVKLK